MVSSSVGVVARRRSNRLDASTQRPQARSGGRCSHARPVQRPSPGPASSVDAATLAAELQLQVEQREKLCSALALLLKLGLVALGSISLVKLSFAYQERLDRHGELDAVVAVESSKLSQLQQRFDHLFTLGGDRRLMDEQDQWIAPNRLRVIWR
ncbi:MAG: hypothetical protein ACON4T_00990 [Synechococcus sp.]